MAKVNILIEDNDDGTLHLNAFFDPKANLNDPASVTQAQALSLKLLEAVAAMSQGSSRVEMKHGQGEAPTIFVAPHDGTPAAPSGPFIPPPDGWNRG